MEAKDRTMERKIKAQVGLALIPVALLGMVYVPQVVESFIAPYQAFLPNQDKEPKTISEKITYPKEGTVVNIGDSYGAAFTEDDSFKGPSVSAMFANYLNVTYDANWQVYSYAQAGQTSEDSIQQLLMAESNGDFNRSLVNEVQEVSGANNVINSMSKNISYQEIESLQKSLFPQRNDVVALKKTIDKGAKESEDAKFAFLQEADKNPLINRVILWDYPDLSVGNDLNLGGIGIKTQNGENKHINISSNSGVKVLLAYVSDMLNNANTKAISKFNKLLHHIAVARAAFKLNNKEMSGLHPNKQGYLETVDLYVERTQFQEDYHFLPTEAK